MSVTLEDYQFELEGYAWGQGLPIFVDEEGFDPGDPEVETQDGRNPITGSRMFGRDTQSGPTWTWAMHVDQTDATTALASLAEMAATWRNTASRLDSGDVVALRYAVADRTRLVYGRPRRFSYKPNNLLLGGTVPPMATFDCVNALHYDDTWSEVDVRLLPSSSGGFTVPFTVPLQLVSEGSGATKPVVIDGDAPTEPVVTFYGPAQNPAVTIGDFTIGLTGQVYAGEVITVDARPWAMTVTDQRGASRGEMLSRKTRLTQARLSPGQYQAVVSGIDITGAAHVTVGWRNANHSL